MLLSQLGQAAAHAAHDIHVEVLWLLVVFVYHIFSSLPTCLALVRELNPFNARVRTGERGKPGPYRDW